MAPKKRIGRKLLRIVGIIGLLGICGWIGWYAFIWLAWQLPPPPETRSMALADLDGDGDLDAFLANGRNEAIEPNTVLFNDGDGNFSNSGQQLGDAGSIAVILRDFDDDGDVDALVSNDWGSFLEYFWNDGRGQFQQSQSLPIPAKRDGYFVGIWRLAAADLNEDGRDDLFLGGCCGGGIPHDPDGNGWTTLNAYNSVWLSGDGSLPQDSGQELGLGSSEAVALADLDGDGDLDAFTADSLYLDDVGEPVAYVPNTVWLNGGAGFFTDSGQQLGSQRSHAVALSDLDGDGDLDAFVGNRGPDEIWLNDGRANFTDSGQTLGDTLTRFLHMADLDGDGDLDAFAGSDSKGQIWLNDGQGYFQKGGSIRYGRSQAPALGDVDGDGAIDIVAGDVDKARVWFNDGAGRFRQ